MPLEGRASTLMPIVLKPAGYRKLRDMNRVNLAKGAQRYFSSQKTFDGDTFRNLSVPPPVTPKRNPDADGVTFDPFLVQNAGDISFVLEEFSLPVIKGVLDTLDPSLKEWSFFPYHRSRADSQQEQPLDPIIYARRTPEGKPSDVRLILVPLGQWEFAPRDFKDFCGRGRFDDRESTDLARSWDNSDQLWAYLYDLSLDLECPFFAVTSYEQWSFGRFSKFYSSACFMPPISLNNRALSVAQMIVYWIHSAFKKPMTFNIPDLPKEKPLTMEYLQSEIQTHRKRFRDLHPSHNDNQQDGNPPKKRKKASLEPYFKLVATDSSSQLKRQTRRKPRRYGKLPDVWPELQRISEDLRLKLIQPQLLVSSLMPDDTISIDFSIAPSVDGPLTPEQIPRRKSDFCKDWIGMANQAEDHAVSSENPLWLNFSKEVWDPAAGTEMSEIWQTMDNECMSPAPGSPMLSECSLSEEEMKMYSKYDEQGIGDVVHNWGALPTFTPPVLITPSEDNGSDSVRSA
ncbi:hypothetical protein M422DRAFT_71594 [Sphaerobolus stellatus SS14]|uniref:Uncharacterized protein n=1 Tax=Sphaerobolus stellatus (strain SS14) TaxID=990650 RepID=A0A0C9UQJ8_SPHS4|nr:hypothetical protein M422DRAFT_71594 [Sphaerobolus stellatus SS14]